jgi:hypothetical protein
VQSGDTRVEVGLIGYEGMTGTAIVLGSDRLPHETYVQVAGEGERISARALRETMRSRKPHRQPIPKSARLKPRAAFWFRLNRRASPRAQNAAERERPTFKTPLYGSSPPVAVSEHSGSNQLTFVALGKRRTRQPAINRRGVARVERAKEKPWRSPAVLSVQSYSDRGS